MTDNSRPIKSFRDLEVYRQSYEAFLAVHREILPKLPEHERFSLIDQLRRSTQAIPRLIAEGYGKRHQPRGFQKYLDDALAESNETVVGLEQCRDLYGNRINVLLLKNLIETYDRNSRQLYRLGEAWRSFKSKPKP